MNLWATYYQNPFQLPSIWTTCLHKTEYIRHSGIYANASVEADNTHHFICLYYPLSNPLQCSCLENPRDGGAWWAAVYRVAQSRTWLKHLAAARLHQKFIPWQYSHFRHSGTDSMASTNIMMHSNFSLFAMWQGISIGQLQFFGPKQAW